jgi:hypothetical protein
MQEDAGRSADPPTQGCMECKAQRPYTIEHFDSGNTGWRCTHGHNISYMDAKIIGSYCKGHWFSVMGTFWPLEIITYAI